MKTGDFKLCGGWSKTKIDFYSEVKAYLISEYSMLKILK